MKRPVEDVKRWARNALSILLMADVLLLGGVWYAAAEHPEAEQKRLERLRDENKKLGADVSRAEAIRTQLPTVRKDCDEFLRDTLLISSSGYSSIVADLEKIAVDAGLPPGAIGFKQKPPDKQGIIEVEVTAVVEGRYSALVKFVNGLERSKNLYLIDAMALNSGRENGARMNLIMRTYFRS
ncbi:MAG TPA: type 4a pilus biogenesis protein PilO [Candidatus Acidoferrales bacterium]|nr:type 4a pilus biogenesis protein PilO [Candidatus Acidoferrales bacterium]